MTFQPFLTDNIYLTASTHSKVLSIVLDTTMKVSFELKMSIVVDAGAPLVRATSNLEGDGPLALRCYEVLNTVMLSI